jgi:hypothetical protein
VPKSASGSSGYEATEGLHNFYPPTPPIKYYQNDETENDEIGMSCITYGGEMYRRIW